MAHQKLEVLVKGVILTAFVKLSILENAILKIMLGRVPGEK